LITTLSLDPAGYIKGQQQAQEASRKTKTETVKSLKEIEATAKKTLDGFAKLRNEVLGLFAAFTAGVGLQQFIAQTIDADGSTGRLAKNLDISTERLSAWQGVLRRGGGSAADANQTFQMLADTLQEISLTGTTSKAGLFRLAGVNASDLKDSSSALLKMSDAFSKMDPARATWVGKALGLPASTINTLEKGRAAVVAMLAEQQKIGVVTEANAQAAIRLQNTLSSLKQALDNIGRAILTSFAPALDLAAQALTKVGEFAQANKPLIIGLFLGFAAAAAVASIPMALLLGEALLFAAPFIAAGVAIGGMIELVMAGVRWFENLIRTNKRLSDAVDAVGSAFSGLGSAISDALAPVAAFFHPIIQSLEAFGAAMGRVFGGAGLAVAKTFVGFLTNEFHALADIIRAVTALLRGDLPGAMSAAKDWSKDIVKDQSKAGSAAVAGAGAPAAANGNASSATALIAKFEGFLDHAKWDRNAYRAGFGSDTTTDPVTGKVSRVTPQTKVSRAQAEADLNRRVNSEFMPRVAAAVGGAWSRFSQSTRDVLTSVAYNYGKLPANVLAAAKAGNVDAIGAAIRAHAADNGGINAQRRYTEASALTAARAAANANVAIQPRYAAGATARYAASSAGVVGGNSVSIDNINIYPPNGDPATIASGIGQAVRKQSFVAQANTGLF
jgi:GH24 family phage-related lysozyme (muramidase)